MNYGLHTVAVTVNDNGSIIVYNEETYGLPGTYDSLDELYEQYSDYYITGYKIEAVTNK